jgi:hypothetical protein
MNLYKISTCGEVSYNSSKFAKIADDCVLSRVSIRDLYNLDKKSFHYIDYIGYCHINEHYIIDLDKHGNWLNSFAFPYQLHIYDYVRYAVISKLRENKINAII